MMKMNDIVKQLRFLLSECESKLVLLPIDMVEAINNNNPEGKWVWIDANKVLPYIVNMMEE